MGGVACGVVFEGGINVLVAGSPERQRKGDDGEEVLWVNVGGSKGEILVGRCAKYQNGLAVEGLLGDEGSCEAGGLALVQVGNGFFFFMAEGARCALPFVFREVPVPYFGGEGVVYEAEGVVS